MKKVLLTVIFLTATLHAQELSELNWISGYWTGNHNGTTIEELWLPPSGGMMIGSHRDVNANGRSSFEYLRIVQTADNIAFLASPGGQPPVSFMLIEFSSNRVVFENPDHDFPQRIIYSRKGDELTARIEDKSGNKGMQWTWTKTKFE